ncbi:MAG: hypothetical protein QXO30_02700 [Candidatus Caldarchaeum sp.]
MCKKGEMVVDNADLRLIRYVKQLLSFLGIETNGPQPKTKHGTPFVDPRNGKTYPCKEGCLPSLRPR